MWPASAIAIGQGGTMCFDELGEALCKLVEPALRGPEARSDKYTVLTEMSPDELASYTPEQLVELLRQRENVAPADLLCSMCMSCMRLC